jgi:hypothetical protein
MEGPLHLHAIAKPFTLVHFDRAAKEADEIPADRAAKPIRTR